MGQLASSGNKILQEMLNVRETVVGPDGKVTVNTHPLFTEETQANFADKFGKTLDTVLDQVIDEARATGRPPGELLADKLPGEFQKALTGFLNDHPDVAINTKPRIVTDTDPLYGSLVGVDTNAAAVSGHGVIVVSKEFIASYAGDPIQVASAIYHELVHIDQDVARFRASAVDVLRDMSPAKASSLISDLQNGEASGLVTKVIADYSKKTGIASSKINQEWVKSVLTNENSVDWIQTRSNRSFDLTSDMQYQRGSELRTAKLDQVQNAKAYDKIASGYEARAEAADQALADAKNNPTELLNSLKDPATVKSILGDQVHDLLDPQYSGTGKVFDSLYANDPSFKAAVDSGDRSTWESHWDSRGGLPPEGSAARTALELKVLQAQSDSNPNLFTENPQAQDQLGHLLGMNQSDANGQATNFRNQNYGYVANALELEAFHGQGTLLRPGGTFEQSTAAHGVANTNKVASSGVSKGSLEIDQMRAPGNPSNPEQPKPGLAQRLSDSMQSMGKQLSAATESIKSKASSLGNALQRTITEGMQSKSQQAPVDNPVSTDARVQKLATAKIDPASVETTTSLNTESSQIKNDNYSATAENQRIAVRFDPARMTKEVAAYKLVTGQLDDPSGFPVTTGMREVPASPNNPKATTGWVQEFPTNSATVDSYFENVLGTKTPTSEQVRDVLVAGVNSDGTLNYTPLGNELGKAIAQRMTLGDSDLHGLNFVVVKDPATGSVTAIQNIDLEAAFNNSSKPELAFAPRIESPFMIEAMKIYSGQNLPEGLQGTFSNLAKSNTPESLATDLGLQTSQTAPLLSRANELGTSGTFPTVVEKVTPAVASVPEPIASTTPNTAPVPFAENLGRNMTNIVTALENGKLSPITEPSKAGLNNEVFFSTVEHNGSTREVVIRANPTEQEIDKAIAVQSLANALGWNDVVTAHAARTIDPQEASALGLPAGTTRILVETKAGNQTTQEFFKASGMERSDIANFLKDNPSFANAEQKIALLNYLLGDTDGHGGNQLPQFDAQGKPVGAVRIQDNDFAMPTDQTARQQIARIETLNSLNVPPFGESSLHTNAIYQDFAGKTMPTELAQDIVRLAQNTKELPGMAPGQFNDLVTRINNLVAQPKNGSDPVELKFPVLSSLGNPAPHLADPPAYGQETKISPLLSPESGAAVKGAAPEASKPIIIGDHLPALPESQQQQLQQQLQNAKPTGAMWQEDGRWIMGGTQDKGPVDPLKAMGDLSLIQMKAEQTHSGLPDVHGANPTAQNATPRVTTEQPVEGPLQHPGEVEQPESGATPIQTAHSNTEITARIEGTTKQPAEGYDSQTGSSNSPTPRSRGYDAQTPFEQDRILQENEDAYRSAGAQPTNGGAASQQPQGTPAKSITQQLKDLANQKALQDLANRLNGGTAVEQSEHYDPLLNDSSEKVEPQQKPGLGPLLNDSSEKVQPQQSPDLGPLTNTTKAQPPTESTKVVSATENPTASKPNVAVGEQVGPPVSKSRPGSALYKPTKPVPQEMAQQSDPASPFGKLDRLTGGDPRYPLGSIDPELAGPSGAPPAQSVSDVAGTKLSAAAGLSPLERSGIGESAEPVSDTKNKQLAVTGNGQGTNDNLPLGKKNFNNPQQDVLYGLSQKSQDVLQFRQLKIDSNPAIQDNTLRQAQRDLTAVATDWTQNPIDSSSPGAAAVKQQRVQQLEQVFAKVAKDQGLSIANPKIEVVPDAWAEKRSLDAAYDKGKGVILIRESEIMGMKPLDTSSAIHEFVHHDQDNNIIKVLALDILRKSNLDVPDMTGNNGRPTIAAKNLIKDIKANYPSLTAELSDKFIAESFKASEPWVSERMTHTDEQLKTDPGYMRGQRLIETSAYDQARVTARTNMENTLVGLATPFSGHSALTTEEARQVGSQLASAQVNDQHPLVKALDVQKAWSALDAVDKGKPPLPQKAIEIVQNPEVLSQLGSKDGAANAKQILQDAFKNANPGDPSGPRTLQMVSRLQLEAIKTLNAHFSSSDSPVGSLTKEQFQQALPTLLTTLIKDNVVLNDRKFYAVYRADYAELESHYVEARLGQLQAQDPALKPVLGTPERTSTQQQYSGKFGVDTGKGRGELGPNAGLFMPRRTQQQSGPTSSSQQFDPGQVERFSAPPARAPLKLGAPSQPNSGAAGAAPSPSQQSSPMPTQKLPPGEGKPQPRASIKLGVPNQLQSNAADPAPSQQGRVFPIFAVPARAIEIEAIICTESSANANDAGTGAETRQATRNTASDLQPFEPFVSFEAPVRESLLSQFPWISVSFAADCLPGGALARSATPVPLYQPLVHFETPVQESLLTQFPWISTISAVNIVNAGNQTLSMSRAVSVTRYKPLVDFNVPIGECVTSQFPWTTTTIAADTAARNMLIAMKNRPTDAALKRHLATIRKHEPFVDFTAPLTECVSKQFPWDSTRIAAFSLKQTPLAPAAVARRSVMSNVPKLAAVPRYQPLVDFGVPVSESMREQFPWVSVRAAMNVHPLANKRAAAIELHNPIVTQSPEMSRSFLPLVDFNLPLHLAVATPFPWINVSVAMRDFTGAPDVAVASTTQSAQASGPDSANNNADQERAADQFTLRPGNVLIARTERTRLITPQTTIDIAPGAHVFIMNNESQVCLFNLSDQHRDSVKLTVGHDQTNLPPAQAPPAQEMSKHDNSLPKAQSDRQAITIGPGHFALLTTEHKAEFERVNPAGPISYRAIKSITEKCGTLFIGEYSVISAMSSVTGLRDLSHAQDPASRRMYRNLVKTVAVLSQMQSGGEPFQTKSKAPPTAFIPSSNFEILIVDKESDSGP